MNNRYALFVGRWQTWHKGHEWLIYQQLDKGKKCWVAIRDVKVDENNPKTAHQILMELSKEPFFVNNASNLLVSIIPDIESINYGRGVGYDVIYHEPPNDIEAISGTKIRNNQINIDGSSKKAYS
jgi:hypothetical protein